MNFVRLYLSKRTKKILYPFRKKIKDIDIDILIKYTLKSPVDKKLKIIVAHRR